MGRYSLAAKWMLVFSVLCLASFSALAQVLLEIDTGRTEGVLTKRPVYQRALMWSAIEKTDTAILFFRGWPGISRIEPDSTFHVGFNNLIQLDGFRSHHISVVLMDCPTDQWGQKSLDTPTGCDDSYRSSARHAEDARLIINRLKTEFNLSKIYLVGHSHGTISAKLLGKALAHEVSGVISSAAVTVQYGGSVSNFGWAGAQFDMNSLKVPVLNIHHQKDACRVTPYATVLAYSQKNLITVRGGVDAAAACGGQGYHSYGGHGSAISMAMIKWIKTRELPQFIGEE